LATLEAAEAARRANEDLFERMGAHAIEIAGEGSERELVVHFAVTPLLGMPKTVRAPGGTVVPVRVTRSAP
jgi:hypothetical protein